MSVRMLTPTSMRGMPTLGHVGPFFDTDDDGGGTGKVRGSDLAQQYNNDVARMAEKLADALNDNFTYRGKNKTLTEQVETLTAKQMPDGATVLSAADKARWDAYVALGKPEELTQQLADGKTAAAERATLQREKTLRTVAEDTGLKPSVLATIDKHYGGLNYEVKAAKEMVNGKQVETKQVMVKQDDKDVALVDFVKANDPDLATLLSASPVAAPAPNGTPTRERVRMVPVDPTQPTIQGPNIRL